ncbi:hypothetical protein LINPERHAP1_LOCUS3121 [Linum perenne]
MHGFSTVDGFVEITECMAEMIKYVANEPSVGLYYVQQHVQNAGPNVIKIRKNVMERSRETSLNTEDMEDSITMVRSMKECGLSIANEMINDIKKSLLIMSEKPQHKGGGLASRSSSGFFTRRSSSTDLPSESDTEESVSLQDLKIPGYYISTMFKTAREKASSFKWPQLDLKDSLPSFSPSQFIASTSARSSPSAAFAAANGDDLDSSYQTAAEELETDTKDEQADMSSFSHDNVISGPEDYEVFKATKAAKLEEWLVETTDKMDELPPSK